MYTQRSAKDYIYLKVAMNLTREQGRDEIQRAFIALSALNSAKRVEERHSVGFDPSDISGAWAIVDKLLYKGGIGGVIDVKEDVLEVLAYLFSFCPPKDIYGVDEEVVHVCVTNKTLKANGGDPVTCMLYNSDVQIVLKVKKEVKVIFTTVFGITTSSSDSLDILKSTQFILTADDSEIGGTNLENPDFEAVLFHGCRGFLDAKEADLTKLERGIDMLKRITK